MDGFTPITPERLRSGPTPRRIARRDDWANATEALAAGRLTLLGLWGARGAVHMALLDEASHSLGLLTLETEASFPSAALHHAPAQRLERTITDLYGLRPEHSPDQRPWLDHGRWGVTHPLGPAGPQEPQPPYAFLPVEGESLHQVPVGPVHAGIIEPGHFRFTGQGETVVRLEERLGYTHKGIEGLMTGASLARGAELAGRTSGDSVVAYQWAFAQAAEAALSVTVPPRALHLRAVLAEVERLANHLGDIGAVCNDAAFAMMLAQCGALRESTLRATATAFGHRFARDVIAPGGVTRDLTPAGAQGLRSLVAEVRARLPRLIALYDGTASLQDRTVATGTLAPALARRFGAGGFVGRASGRDFDTRRDLPYAPYDGLAFTVPARNDGDVNARVWIRVREAEQSLALLSQLLDTLPNGPILTPLTATGPAEGLGLVEGFRGDILVWLALGPDGRIARCHLRDPSWFQWPLLEAIIEGNIIADFPLCNKSFNCAYSGHDL
ncbi:MAG: hydrogenase expression protein HypE [Rhodobacteraceae bacterium]|nr:hydrogenase expression protein HypE [Paracoccaceae bacterium]